MEREEGHRNMYRKDGDKQARDSEEKETANDVLVGVVFKKVL